MCLAGRIQRDSSKSSEESSSSESNESKETKVNANKNDEVNVSKSKLSEEEIQRLGITSEVYKDIQQSIDSIGDQLDIQKIVREIPKCHIRIFFFS